MLEDEQHRIFQNYLGEFLLCKDDVRIMRAKLNRIYQSKETMASSVNDYYILTGIKKVSSVNDITEEIFQASKTKAFKELDIYEAKLNE